MICEKEVVVGGVGRARLEKELKEVEAGVYREGASDCDSSFEKNSAQLSSP